MERRALPGLDEVRAELSVETESQPEPATRREPLELEEPGTWEDRRQPERDRRGGAGLMARLGRLLGRPSDRS